jgi:hypothetical protein
MEDDGKCPWEILLIAKLYLKHREKILRSCSSKTNSTCTYSTMPWSISSSGWQISTLLYESVIEDILLYVCPTLLSGSAFLSFV